MMIVINQFGIPDNSGQIAATTTPPAGLDFPVWRGEWVSDKPQYVEWHKVQAWERIMQERDRRKYLGVKVGEHWFHSDDPSRIQQIALAMMGNAIPPGLQWKTLTLSPPPVFVEMTPALAQGIFTATAASDAAIFAAAETHRIAIEASASPESYDFSVGWPASIEDTP